MWRLLGKIFWQVGLDFYFSVFHFFKKIFTPHFIGFPTAQVAPCAQVCLSVWVSSGLSGFPPTSGNPSSRWHGSCAHVYIMACTVDKCPTQGALLLRTQSPWDRLGIHLNLDRDSPVTEDKLNDCLMFVHLKTGWLYSYVSFKHVSFYGP